MSAAKAGTAVYVWSEQVPVDPEDSAAMSGAGLHVPVVRALERRVPVAEWHRDNTMPPPGQYHIEHGAGVPSSSVAEASTWADLLAEGVAAGDQAASAAYRASLLAPLDAALEPEGE